MEYLVDNHKYSLSYSQLKEDYERYHAMQDEDFLQSIISVMHFVCIVSYFKETPGYILTSDEGLIHQLVHLLDENTKPDALHHLREIREQFEIWCKLA